MKKLIMAGPAKSKVVECDIPKINENQVLIKTVYVGLCHSEWYPWTVAKEGEIFGHEPMGVIAEVGKNVTGFKVGDRVSGMGGGIAEYMVQETWQLIKIPDNVSDEDGIVEPHSCILSAVGRVPFKAPGDTAVVVGAGYMGLGTISLLKLNGAGRLIAIDPRAEARENALRFGATEAYAPSELPSGFLLNFQTVNLDLSDESNQSTNIFQTGFQSVVEFAGTADSLKLAGDLVCAHGYLGIGGYHNDGNRNVDFMLWNFKSMIVDNLHERRDDYKAHCAQNSMNLIAGGQWQFKGVCNHIYSMEDADQGFRDMDIRPKGFIKGLIRCSK